MAPSRISSVGMWGKTSAHEEAHEHKVVQDPLQVHLHPRGPELQLQVLPQNPDLPFK